MLIADSYCITVINSNTLLTGIGNELRLYHECEESGNLISTRFPYKTKDKIHGIAYREVKADQKSYNVVIYGGKELLLLTLINVIKPYVSLKSLYNTKSMNCLYLE